MRAQGVKETVDFCVDCMAYKLLFSDADRKPRAKLIYDTYLVAGADSPVNVPDTMIKHVERDLGSSKPDLFDETYDEVLQVCAHNLFAHFMPRMQEREEAAAKEKEREAKKAAAAKPKAHTEQGGGGGGCCLLM